MIWQAILTSAGNDDEQFANAGLVSPKNWQPFRGTTLIERALEASVTGASRATLVLRGLERAMWESSNLARLYPNLDVVYTNGQTGGALCTALLGLSDLDLEAPLLIAPGDSFVDAAPETLVQKFLATGAEAGTLVIAKSDPKYSYVRMTPTGRIAEIAEKRVISTHASTGLFFFRKASFLLEAAEWVLGQNMHTNGEYYLSSSLNYLVMEGRHVVALQPEPDSRYMRLATPKDFLDEVVG